MEPFVLPLTSFDVSLLPLAARDPASTMFRTAIDDYFRAQFRAIGMNGVVDHRGNAFRRADRAQIPTGGRRHCPVPARSGPRRRPTARTRPDPIPGLPRSPAEPLHRPERIPRVREGPCRPRTPDGPEPGSRPKLGRPRRGVGKREPAYSTTPVPYPVPTRSASPSTPPC
jgi:hypothetical protein